MEECKICVTKRKKRNKNKHDQSVKQKYLSILIINKYKVRNSEFNKLKISFSHTMMSTKRNSIIFLNVLCGIKIKCYK